MKKFECDCIKSMELVKSYKNSMNSKKSSYLAIPKYGKYNQLKNETYDLQSTNSKIAIMIKMIIDHMSMHCSINMWNSRQ